MGYEFLEHTADVKFRATGKDLEEAFKESANALIATINDGVDVKPAEVREISARGDDLENLLYNFLEEFLFLLDAESFVVVEVKAIKIDENDFSLIAELSGDDVKNYDDFSNDVKAVTYSDMKVKKVWEMWEVVGVFDV